MPTTTGICVISGRGMLGLGSKRVVPQPTASAATAAIAQQPPSARNQFTSIPITLLGLLDPDEGPAVALAEDAHQRREPHAGVLRRIRPQRETDRVYAHAPRAGLVLAIDHVHRLHHLVDRAAREFVAEHVQADLLVLRVICANC